ncbi:hypothetical protein [Mycoplasmopsis cricetuli]|uniref:hypothetical protein n=1 Tax=Mycoplasmopsis cricetuli TaxID=171283 RepID=UPI00046E68B9|nr:hypothetical protein [Mycoplasmopsis cricetuli]
MNKEIKHKQLYEEVIVKSTKKYRLSFYGFVFINILAIFITASIIILNLFAIRYNPFPKETMIFFILLAIIGVVISFISSVQTFLSIKDSKDVLKNNIEVNENMIEKINKKDQITREDIDNILNTF